MEDITKELNSATEYLRAMKKSGHHKGDCDNILMHLANIEDLVNKLFIANVSVSLFETLQDLTEVYEEREAKASKMGNWSEAFQNEIRVGVLQHLAQLHKHKNNER